MFASFAALNDVVMPNMLLCLNASFSEVALPMFPPNAEEVIVETNEKARWDRESKRQRTKTAAGIMLTSWIFILPR
jgi:amino acid permease